MIGILIAIFIVFFSIVACNYFAERTINDRSIFLPILSVLGGIATALVGTMAICFLIFCFSQSLVTAYDVDHIEDIKTQRNTLVRQLTDIEDVAYRVTLYENVHTYNEKIINHKKYHDDNWFGFLFSDALSELELIELEDYLR